MSFRFGMDKAQGLLSIIRYVNVFVSQSRKYFYQKLCNQRITKVILTDVYLLV